MILNYPATTPTTLPLGINLPRIVEIEVQVDEGSFRFTKPSDDADKISV